MRAAGRKKRTAIGGSNGQVCIYTQTENVKKFEQRVVSEVRCANAFSVGSSNLSLATKSCACAST
jgi:hypothetical protein